jgi:hypothetical protein
VATKLIAQIPHLVMELATLRDRVDVLESKVLPQEDGESAATVSFRDYSCDSVLIQDSSR